MDQNTSSKINDSVNTFIKCLNFAERLFQEQANLDWVPGWLMTTLGINSCALGIFQEQRYVVYFACDDCSVEEGRAEAAGGKVLQPKMSLGEHGFCSVLMDTEGNTIGLHSMN